MIHSLVPMCAPEDVRLSVALRYGLEQVIAHDDASYTETFSILRESDARIASIAKRMIVADMIADERLECAERLACTIEDSDAQDAALEECVDGYSTRGLSLVAHHVAQKISCFKRRTNALIGCMFGFIEEGNLALANSVVSELNISFPPSLQTPLRYSDVCQAQDSAVRDVLVFRWLRGLMQDGANIWIIRDKIETISSVPLQSATRWQLTKRFGCDEDAFHIPRLDDRYIALAQAKVVKAVVGVDYGALFCSLQQHISSNARSISRCVEVLVARGDIMSAAYVFATAQPEALREVAWEFICESMSRLEADAARDFACSISEEDTVPYITQYCRQYPEKLQAYLQERFHFEIEHDNLLNAREMIFFLRDFPEKQQFWLARAKAANAQSIVIGFHEQGFIPKEQAEELLVWAHENGHALLLFYFVSHGVEIDLSEQEWASYTRLAILHDREDVVGQLVEKLQNVDEQDGDGNTLLHLAVERLMYDGGIQALLEKGAKTTIRNFTQETVFQIADRQLEYLKRKFRHLVRSQPVTLYDEAEIDP